MTVYNVEILCIVCPQYYNCTFKNRSYDDTTNHKTSNKFMTIFHDICILTHNDGIVRNRYVVAKVPLVYYINLYIQEGCYQLLSAYRH